MDGYEPRPDSAVTLLDPPERTSAAEAVPADAGSAVDADADAPVTEAEPVAEVEAALVEPVVEPVDAEVTDAEPVDAEPVDTEPVAGETEPAVDAGPAVYAGPADDAEQGDAAEPVAEVDPAEVGPAGDTEPADAQPDPTVPAHPRRRRLTLRRRTAVAAVVLVGALAVSAFARVGPSVGVDQHFVDAVRAQGHVIDSGDQQALLVSAAHKICERRQSHSTVAQRRATALSTDELTVVQEAFAGDNRGFTALALHTYC